MTYNQSVHQLVLSRMSRGVLSFEQGLLLFTYGFLNYQMAVIALKNKVLKLQASENII